MADGGTKIYPKFISKISRMLLHPPFIGKMVDAFWNVVDWGDYNVYKVWIWEMLLLGVYGSCHNDMTTSGARMAQRIKTAYLKHKTHHNPIVCIMEQGLATTGRAAEEARADEESGSESESDGAADSPTGFALGSFRKRKNPWNLIFEKFCSGKTDDSINTLRESRDTFLDKHAREHCVLDYPFVVQFCRAEDDSVFKETTQSHRQL